MSEKLFDFIKSSPTAYHTVKSCRDMLDAAGYVRIYENDRTELKCGGKYYITRDGSSVIAFRIPEEKKGFMIVASHSDSPAFRVKMSGEKGGAYIRLDVERYGGMILYTWLDRPLSVAGRIVVETDSGLREQLVNIDRDLAVIPSVAVHLNRGVNDGYKFNPAVDMLPLVSTSSDKSIISAIAKEAGVECEKIISHDLFLYNRDEPRAFGIDGELMLSPRLDDLECVYSSLSGFLASGDTDSVPVFAVFNNEEVGSETKQGAASTFLHHTLRRIAGEDYEAMLESSFMVSADNAHALHPNHPELSDAANAPTLNGGVVIKYNANQRYATDGVSAAVFTKICNKAGVKVQTYYNRADMPGGSTLGSISDTVVSVPTVDIGLAQLAMHSANECAGVGDLCDMVKALTQLYNTSFSRHGEEIEIHFSR